MELDGIHLILNKNILSIFNFHITYSASTGYAF